MSINFDVLIIGGGVIGLSLARELHRRRVGRIAVVEGGRVGGEASYAAAGMLSPNAECERIDDFYWLCDESRRMYPGLAAELLSETAVDIELDRSGTLCAAPTEEDAIHVGERYSIQVAAGIPVEKLTAAETLKAEPCLAPGVRGSLYFPNDWQVENRLLLTALTKYAVANGIKIKEGTPVDSLIVENGHVTGASSGRGQLRADMTVLATGAWTSLIKLGDVPIPFGVKPIRGQIISFKPAERTFRRVIYSPRGYLVPRADGRVLAGATVEDVGFDKSVTVSASNGLWTSAIEIAPCLEHLEVIETWAGLRPFARDGLPVIGDISGLEGLLVATAHYRNGILLAPVTAKLLTDRIVDGEDSEYFNLFGPDRFAGETSAARAGDNVV